jgi:hypothetical protein
VCGLVLHSKPHVEDSIPEKCTNFTYHVNSIPVIPLLLSSMLSGQILVTPPARYATIPFGIVLYSVKYIVKNINRIPEIPIGLTGITGF